MTGTYQLVKTGKRTSAFPEYTLSTSTREFLVSGGIIAQEETPQDFLERVITAIFSPEHTFGTPSADIKKMMDDFFGYLVEGSVMPGTPILTNAGRYESALSSCAVVPIDLREADRVKKELICSYYKQNMGVGFNLTPYEDPLSLLCWINEVSRQETATGQYDRYIGNMGILHISHPRVAEFISAKRQRNMKHFNISIDVTEDFMKRAEAGETFVLSDGTKVFADDLLEQIAENAWYNGDPGLLFLERMNKDNPIAEIERYVSTAPCAEVGLVEGETCHFGYINLGKLLLQKGRSVEINYDKLEKITQLLTRALDNAIEYSIPRYPTARSGAITRKNRRIGIGICGLADTLLAYRLPYESQEARKLARDVLSFINYTSKRASVLLAEQRGPCVAMSFSQTNKYLRGSYIEDKYASTSSHTVTSKEWEQLATLIRSTGNLRNISTTALPPTGRASILLNATPSIEPLFSIFANDGSMHKNIVAFLSEELEERSFLLEQVCQEASLVGSFQGVEALSTSCRECLKTAKEISPLAHLQMVAEVAGTRGVIDESASKTVNLAHNSTVGDVRDIFLLSHHLGLKNVSVYRDKTMVDQPIAM